MSKGKLALTGQALSFVFDGAAPPEFQEGAAAALVRNAQGEWAIYVHPSPGSGPRGYMDSFGQHYQFSRSTVQRLKDFIKDTNWTHFSRIDVECTINAGHVVIPVPLAKLRPLRTVRSHHRNNPPKFRVNGPNPVDGTEGSRRQQIAPPTQPHPGPKRLHLRDAVAAINAAREEMGDDLELRIEDGRLKAFVIYT